MKKRKIKKVIFLFIPIIILSIFMGFSIAKENIKITLPSKSFLAKPIIILKEGEPIQIEGNCLEQEYFFSIHNYEDNQVNEVPLRYTIEIIGPKEEGIQFELLQDEEKIFMENRKTNFIFLGVQEKLEHFYQLKIKYDKQKVNSVQDIVGNFQIKVHSEQVRGI